VVHELQDAALEEEDDAFVADLVAFGRDYAAVVREDHRRFVEAFRADRVPGVSSAEESL
jgi:hypothetical protein